MEKHFRTQDEWRNWLVKNHGAVEGLWLVYFKKGSGIKSIDHSQALDEALCFGWIDGKIMRIDGKCYKQWFTPRRKGSRWSAVNMEKAGRLIELGKMQPPGLEEYNKAANIASVTRRPDNHDFTLIPEDLRLRLESEENAMENFSGFPPSARRMYLDWLEAAKRPETREKRLTAIAERSARNIKPGML